MKQTIQAQKVHTPEPSIPQGTPWLTYAEAALYARKSLRTVQGWVYRGEIKVYRPDGGPVLNKKDIDKFIESRAQAPVGV
jgi:excisionase family DNA binding protein